MSKKRLAFKVARKFLKKAALNHLTREIRSEYPPVELSMSSYGDNVTLHKVVLPKEARGYGMGTDIMERIISWADINHKTITLTPSTDFGGSSVKRLKSFYKRFGFVENKGRNKNYEISESMYRLPNTY